MKQKWSVAHLKIIEVWFLQDKQQSIEVFKYIFCVTCSIAAA